MANVLDYYIRGADEARNNALAGAQQMSLLTQLSGVAQKQRLDQAFRDELAQAGPNADEKTLADIAMKYSGPEGILKHQDIQQRVKANQEAVLARLQQQGSQFDQMMAFRYQNAKNAKEQRAIENQWKQGRLNQQNYALRVANARLYDETGINLGIPQTPDIVPQQQNLAYPQAANSPEVQSLDPQARAAFDMVNSGQAVSAAGGNGQPATIVRPAGATATPSFNPVAAPSPEVAPDIPSVAPTTPASLSMQQSGGLEGRFPPVGQGTPQEPIPSAAVTTPQAAPAASGKPPANIQAMIDAEPRPAQKRRILARWQDGEINKELKASVNLAGGRESVMTGRVMNAAEQAARAVENIASIPIESQSRGIFGGRGQEAGILNAGKETLANTMTTQDVQSYNVLSTGLTRTLGAIETSGLGVTNNLMHQMEGIIFKEGDTNLTKLKKLAEIRQIVDAGMETVNSNPRNAPEIKAQANRILQRIDAAIPFTQMDIINLEKQQRANPNTTMSQIIGAKRGTSSDDEALIRKYLGK